MALGDRSLDLLESVDHRLRSVVLEVSRHYPVMVLEGHRDQARQERLYQEGMTRVRWPHSKHNDTPARAVDLAPLPIDWQDMRRWYWFAGFVIGTARQMGVRIRNGLDWDQDLSFTDQTFHDGPHYELLE